ncbi:MAG: GAF domain-containing protein [Chloroflexi bacterium]|nr:GAF domain-containing protein [Chloroflexota bacterium]
MFRLRPARLQVKLTLTFLVTLLLPAAMIAVYTSHSQTNHLIQNAVENQLNEARTKARLVELAFNRATADVVFLTQGAAITSYAEAVSAGDSPAQSAALERLKTSFAAFSRNMQVYDQVRLLGLDGMERVGVNYRDGDALVVPVAELQNQAGHDYFDEALELARGQVFTSALHLNVERGQIELPHKPVIRFSTPLYSGNRLVGVVVTTMLADTFLSLVTADQPEARAFLIDASDGTYLAGPDAGRLFGRDLQTGSSFFTDFPNDASAMLVRDEGALFGTGDQPDTLVSFSRVRPPGQDSINWMLYLTLPTHTVLSQLDGLRNDILTIAGFSLLGAVALSLIVTRGLAHPIVQLATAARQIGQGQLDTPIPVPAHRDEITELAEAFAVMAKELHHTVTTMEATIASRTRDLETAAQVNAQISTILDTNRLLQDVVDLTKERFRLYHAHIYLLDDSGTTLRLASGAGHVGRQMVAEGKQIALDNPQSIVAQAARTRRGVIINDVTTASTFLPNPLLPDTRAELAVPLVARGQLLGVLDVQSAETGYFSQNTLAVIELMAGQIASAISNARLYEAAERTSRHEQALGKIDRKIQGAVTMDDILKTTVRELGKALRVPYTAIELQLPEEATTPESAPSGYSSAAE